MREKAWKIYLTDKPSSQNTGDTISETKNILNTDTTKKLDKEIMSSIEQKLKTLNGDAESEVFKKQKDDTKNSLQKKKSLEKKV